MFTSLEQEVKSASVFNRGGGDEFRPALQQDLGLPVVDLLVHPVSRLRNRIPKEHRLHRTVKHFIRSHDNVRFLKHVEPCTCAELLPDRPPGL